MKLQDLLGMGVVNIWQPNIKGTVIAIDWHNLPLVTVRSATGYDHKLPIQDLGFDESQLFDSQPPVRVSNLIVDLPS
jgi:hypothetical protein